MKYLKQKLFLVVRGITRLLKPSTKLRNLIMWPLTSRLLPSDYTEVIQRDGYKIYAGLEDHLNRLLLFYGAHQNGVWEPVTMRLLKQVLSGAKIVVTAGSHIGFLNLELLPHISDKGSIYTFEPSRGLFERSKMNIELNGAEDRVSLTHCALGDEVGVGELYVSDLRTSLIPYTQHHLDKAERETVHITTLDTWKDEKKVGKVDLLSLDVEGYELAALRGATRMIHDDRPIICFEIAKKIRGAVDADDAYAFLRERDYEVFAIEDDYALLLTDTLGMNPIRLHVPESFQGTHGYFNCIACHIADPRIKLLRSMSA